MSAVRVNPLTRCASAPTLDAMTVTTHVKLPAKPYDSTFHRLGTFASAGRCSWHGRTCPDAPVISFVDGQGHRQAGCERAHRELVLLGLMAPLVRG
jgi:hypothetical protein